MQRKLNNLRRRTVLCAALFALLTTGALLAQPGADAILHEWTRPDGKSKVTFVQCGDKYCGRISWMAEPNNADGTARTDVNNPNPRERGVKLTELEIIHGLRFDGEKWSGGKIYRADEGKTYNCYIELADDGKKLRVFSFLSIPAMGEVQEWTR